MKAAITTQPMPVVLRMMQIFMAALVGLAVFVGVAMLAPAGYAAIYDGYIYEGISIAGIDVSGLSLQEATALLNGQVNYSAQGSIAFQDGNQVWTAKPGDLGVYIDIGASVQHAYQSGRSGDYFEDADVMFEAWFSGLRLPIVAAYDERKAETYLRGLATQIDKPIIEATLGVNGIEVIVRAGQIGRMMDVRAALEVLRDPLQGMRDAVIPLTVIETAPVILDASEQAEIARRILSAPLVIQVPNPLEGDPGPWTIEPQALASMLSIERVQTSEGERYQVGLNSQTLRTFLQEQAPAFERQPISSRFIFNDETRQLEVIEKAVIGRSLDVEASLQKVNEKLFGGEHTVELVMIITNPPVTDEMSGAELGITELVSSYTSYFYGSSASRMQNIQTAAARFHGVMVAPGATFSMAEILGEVSLDNGYAEALIIYGNRTIQGVGGGVCQVSTTLFRTVFFGGFPIVERNPHAYRVSYYEQTASGAINTDLAGLDATVFVPLVDFKFVNDTPHWLLMETYFSQSARRLTWKFYSTSDGRTVEWNTTGLTNIVEPDEPVYEENPALAAGEIKQVDWEVDGADVTVFRKVMRAGSVYFEDKFATHYLPWRSIYQYGPGTVLTPEPTSTPEPTAAP
jgi:vancomycin resistance protein YoaR